MFTIYITPSFAASTNQETPPPSPPPAVVQWRQLVSCVIKNHLETGKKKKYIYIYGSYRFFRFFWSVSYFSRICVFINHLRNSIWLYSFVLFCIFVYHLPCLIFLLSLASSSSSLSLLLSLLLSSSSSKSFCHRYHHRHRPSQRRFRRCRLRHHHRHVIIVVTVTVITSYQLSYRHQSFPDIALTYILLTI